LACHRLGRRFKEALRLVALELGRGRLILEDGRAVGIGADDQLVQNGIASR
jgi:hypothetical protein